jgi:hypothetical protein
MLRKVASMIQLTYQPAHDAFHAIFRFLRMSDGLEKRTIEFDKLRILDFYLLFPHRISEIRFKQGHASFRRLATKYADRQGYAAQPSSNVLFHSMAPMHEAAAQTLADSQAIDPNDFIRGIVTFRPYPIPAKLASRLSEANQSEWDLVEFLNVLAADYPILGRGGLKDRTSLMDFRYDAV